MSHVLSPVYSHKTWFHRLRWFHRSSHSGSKMRDGGNHSVRLTLGSPMPSKKPWAGCLFSRVNKRWLSDVLIHHRGIMEWWEWHGTGSQNKWPFQWPIEITLCKRAGLGRQLNWEKCESLNESSQYIQPLKWIILRWSQWSTNYKWASPSRKLNWIDLNYVSLTILGIDQHSDNELVSADNVVGKLMIIEWIQSTEWIGLIDGFEGK